MSLASRIKALEESDRTGDCPTCGWPHLRFEKINLDPDPAAERPPLCGTCPTCGRSWKFGEIKFEGDKQIPAEDLS